MGRLCKTKESEEETRPLYVVVAHPYPPLLSSTRNERTRAINSRWGSATYDLIEPQLGSMLIVPWGRQLELLATLNILSLQYRLHGGW